MQGTSSHTGGALGILCTQRCPSGTDTALSQHWPQESSVVWPGLLFLALQTTPGPNQDAGTDELCVCPPQLGHIASYRLSCAKKPHKTQTGSRAGLSRDSCHSLSFLGHAHHHTIPRRNQPLGRHPTTRRAGTGHALLTKPQRLPSSTQIAGDKHQWEHW